MNNLILHLSLIKGVGPVTIAQVIEGLERNHLFSHAYELSAAQWHSLDIPSKMVQLITQGLQDTKPLDEELALFQRYNVSWATYKDPEYPEMLKHIHAAPAVIMWRGDILYDKAMAVVGSRDATEYGKQAVDFFVPQLVEQGYTIVSGGAYGVDAWAHEAALKSNGKTIVILGSGIAKPYPREHIKLCDTVIANGGALLSIFPVMTSAAPGNFPARNRVISGLSHGCVVVQAASQSGARITAEYALQQGRSVFAIPGSFNHPLSEGCHDLIKQGATILTSFDDIAQEFGITQYRKVIADECETVTASCQEDAVVVKKPKSIPIESPENDHPVVTFCKNPQSFDDILKQFPDKNPAELQDLLFDLSLDGRIEQDFSGMWKKTTK